MRERTVESFWYSGAMGPSGSLDDWQYWGMRAVGPERAGKAVRQLAKLAAEPRERCVHLNQTAFDWNRFSCSIDGARFAGSLEFCTASRTVAISLTIVPGGFPTYAVRFPPVRSALGPSVHLGERAPRPKTM